MRFLAAAAAALALAAVLAWPPHPAAADEVDEKRIVEIVEKLLRERPELVVEALTAYQERQELAKQTRQKEALSANRAVLFDRDGDPFIGDPDAKVTVVEFFDYRCGYCKRVLNDVVDLVRDNDDVKVVFKEFPILGEASVLASQVALAVHLVAPKKYGEFHKRLMGSRGSFSEESLLQLADALGVDADAVKARMDDDEVQNALRSNYELAQQLGINGTPAFVIGDQIVPGAVSRQTLDRLVEEQRG